MKQYIVLISMIGLGIFLFALILGPGEGSLVNFMGGSMRKAMESGFQ